jgi:hypothetical protein
VGALSALLLGRAGIPVTLVEREAGVQLDYRASTFHPPTLEAEISALPGWRRVRYLGQVPRDEVRRVMSGGRTGLVLNHPTLNYVDAYSTKMFEYMALGIPVVCSNFPLWTEIVSGADCGIAVDPHDPQAIAAAIRALTEDPERAARLGAAQRPAREREPGRDDRGQDQVGGQRTRPGGQGRDDPAEADDRRVDFHVAGEAAGEAQQHALLARAVEAADGAVLADRLVHGCCSFIPRSCSVALATRYRPPATKR